VSVWLAGRVVPRHTFNLVRIGLVDFPAITVLRQRCEMKDSTVAAEAFFTEVAATPIEVALSLRLLKAFLSLPPDQWPEIIERMEQRAIQQAAPQPGRDEHSFS
jgi:hypothetical protein